MAADEIREHSVGFAIKNSLLKMIEPGVNNTEGIFSFRPNTTESHVNLVSMCAPTLSALQETKAEFYGQLDTVTRGIFSQELLPLLGDFNARVGADHDY